MAIPALVPIGLEITTSPMVKWMTRDSLHTYAGEMSRNYYFTDGEVDLSV